MADDVIGLVLVKVNGIFHMDVKNSRMSDKRTIAQHVTAGGVRKAIGVELCSGSFDEVIPRSGALNWRSLRNFSLEFYDKETSSIVVASFAGCDWGGLDTTADEGSASTTKAVTWQGTDVTAA